MLDVELARLEAQERVKQIELAERKALLAERIRSAYDTNRTSMLESFLSSGSFSDLLAEMSYYIDVGEQDKALAQQVVQDQEELAAMHEMVVATQARTDELRVTTAAQKVTLNKSLKGLKDAKAELRRLEKETQRNLAIQRATYAKVAVNKKNAAKALAAAAKAQKVLAGRIADIVRRQSQQGNIPSQYNGTLAWPMSGNVTQNFGCTGFSWEPPLGSCAHFHQGIDIVAPYGTAVRASGDGVVAYIGWNYADGADPAWIVIIAHSSGLQTWYAHMTAAYPGNIHQGSMVKAGQVIGHEGNTGPLDRRPPPLGGHAQRGLRQPAAVPLARTSRELARPRGPGCSPAGNAAFTFVRAARASIDRGLAQGPDHGSWRLDGP